MESAFLEGMLFAGMVVVLFAYVAFSLFVIRFGLVGGVLGAVMWYTLVIGLAMRNGVWADPRIQKMAGFGLALSLILILVGKILDITAQPSSS